MVFAPHPDDETLGCGGTIARKKQAGADIKIVFMTDGCQSHAHLMPAAQLKEIRAKEAIAAAQKLGIPHQDVFFLGIQDGTLARHHDGVVAKVAPLLLQWLPEEVFVPYFQDGVPDHDATNHIVVAAAKQCGLAVTLYEYPVWFWTHWPWATTDTPQPSGTLPVVPTLRTMAQFLRDFQCAIDVGDVLETKRVALQQHASQMTRLMPHPRWFTLKDVAGGDFLDCCLQRYEVFHRYPLGNELLSFSAARHSANINRVARW
ncbi:MAG: PIG-L deacetylase family protein [Leptolyngbyaceae cyanobacterium]